MGGIAMRAPVLATIFLIVAFATLAMPGSGNFVGEFLILLGLFQTKMVVLDHRLHRRRDGEPSTCCGSSSARCTTAPGRRSQSRELRWRDALVLVPFLGVIGLFALYPQIELSRAEKSVTHRRSAPPSPRRRLVTSLTPVAHTDDATLASRLAACTTSTARTSTTRRSRRSRRCSAARSSCCSSGLAALALRARAARAGADAARPRRRRSRVTIWQWNDHISAIAGALAVDDLTLALTIIFVAAGAAAVVLSWRAQAPRESAHGEYHALLLASIAGMAILVGGAEPGHAVHRHRAALDPALRAVRHRDAPRVVARVGAEVPDHRLGRLGDAALRPRAALRRDRRDRLLGDRRLDRRRPRLRRAAADRRSRWCSSGSASRPRWRRSTSGRPTSTRARRRRSRRSWRSRRRPPRSACCCGSSTSRSSPTSSTGARRSRRSRRSRSSSATSARSAQSSLKRMLAYSSVAQAGYIMGGVVVSTQLGAARDGLLPRRLPADEPRGVRGDHRARARDAATATTSTRSPGSAARARCWPGR